MTQADLEAITTWLNTPLPGLSCICTKDPIVLRRVVWCDSLLISFRVCGRSASVIVYRSTGIFEMQEHRETLRSRSVIEGRAVAGIGAALQALRDEAERKGWRVKRGKKYHVMRCPCGIHQKTVKLTPSDPNYVRNLRGWLKRTGCWEEGR